MARAALMLAAMCMSLWPARALGGAAPAQRRAALRLDTRLAMLAPFVEPNGHPATALSSYRHGPFSRWLDRSWQTLDWEIAPVDEGSGESRPINPRFDRTAVPKSACLARVIEPERGWPFVHEERHWFAEAEVDDALWLDARWMPPWLTRLDVYFAHAVLAKSGCGRGGDCSPGATFPAEGFAALWDALSPKAPATPWWVCRERPVLMMRHGREQDRFVLLRCDGSVPDDALERLSVLARPAEVPRPDALGPVAALSLLQPRLLWVLHQVALKWPWRSIYVFSGYRRAEATAAPGGHKSRHYEGRALDIKVQGVDNETLLELCRALPDVGCGYYPNNKFVHVDVRARGTGEALWIDASAPGEPAHYVDSWPGVVDGGAMVWGIGPNSPRPPPLPRRAAASADPRR